MTQQRSHLPVSTASGPTDVARSGWPGITVAVAWTLLANGVRLRPAVLRDARDHVLFHVPPRTSAAHAEDLACRLTARFVTRARRQAPEDSWAQDGAMLLSPRWRRALDRSLTPLTEVVFRQHYGDGRTFGSLERSLQVDQIALEAARGGLREVIRRAAAVDDVPLDDWSSERIDRLLCRLAAFSPWPCPPIDRVVGGHEKEHQKGCARCDRAARLLRAKLLAPEDLLPPATAARPDHVVRILALHFHPEGRHHRARIIAEADVPTLPDGDDMLLVDLSRPDEVATLLVLAAEVGAPARDHLRGAVLEGPGRWSRHGLLGPLVDRARETVRSRPWGVVDAVGELPSMLPEPPSARRWWFAVGALGLAAAWSLAGVLHPAPPAVDHVLDVHFTQGRGGIWTAFDVDERAVVALVREVDGALDIIDAGKDSPSKVRYAVGDGSYRLHSMGRGVLVAASSVPIDDLQAMVATATRSGEPLSDLARRIESSAPRAHVRVHRRP